MRIDWLTVGAQWINFLVLMWLLKRFLYRPIIDAMDRRQQNIEAHSEEARLSIEQAEQQARDYREKLTQLEAQRAKLLAEAREEAHRERERLITVAREETQTLSRQWRREFEREKNDLQRQLQHQLGCLSIDTARKALHDLTGQALEQALFENFLERLRDLPDADKRLLTASAGNHIELASSFELSPSLRDRFSNAVRDVLAPALSVRFTSLADSRLGLLLSSPSYTLEWRLEQYFADLSAELDGAFNGTKPFNTDAE